MAYNFNNSKPIYMQIMDLIKEEVVSGKRKPGSKIEPVRELSQILGVNPNTLQKAFTELERDAYLYTDRTIGRFVTEDVDLIKEMQIEIGNAYMTAFLNQMKGLGYSEMEVILLIKNFIGGHNPS